MLKKHVTIVGAITAAALGAHAGAAIVSTTITADNHYALYADGPGGIFLVGGNEPGAGGSPGTYNWSLPESYDFETLGYVYIAVWSDDSVAQGLLAQMSADGLDISTGHPDWQVMMTDLNLGENSPRPAASEIDSFVDLADLNGLWETPYVGPENLASTAPWGQVPGISEAANWTWGNPDNVADPLTGGKDHDEYQIFRMYAVPGPGGAVAIGVAGLLLYGRRRRTA